MSQAENSQNQTKPKSKQTLKVAKLCWNSHGGSLGLQRNPPHLIQLDKCDPIAQHIKQPIQIKPHS